MFFVADAFSLDVQYGGRIEMCDEITSSSFLNDTWAGLASIAERGGVRIQDYDSTYLRNTTVDFSKNMRQWTWQYCTEFGYFQEPNEVYQTRSSALSIDYWLDFCHRVFDYSLLPPQSDFYNTYLYKGLNITGENIFFFTASEDPWQYAGMRKIHDPSHQSGMASYHISCDTCAHCVDLHAEREDDPMELKWGRYSAYHTIGKWLAEDLEKRQVSPNLSFLQ